VLAARESRSLVLYPTAEIAAPICVAILPRVLDMFSDEVRSHAPDSEAVGKNRPKLEFMAIPMIAELHLHLQPHCVF
jgi:hypothetical protein